MQKCVWGGGGRHGTWMDCCLKLASLIGLSPLTFALAFLNPFPLQAAVCFPLASKHPSALTFPVWPILTSLNPFPFPW